jgi:hypothetical protein
MSESEIRRLTARQQRSLARQEALHQELNKADQRGDEDALGYYRSEELGEVEEYYALQDEIDSYINLSEE